MFINVFMLYLYFLIGAARELLEGDYCFIYSYLGVCAKLSTCRSAIMGVRNGHNPHICSYDGTDLIVCCLESYSFPIGHPMARPPVTRPPLTFITEYTPFGFSNGNWEKWCKALPPSMTSKKTGQKAFDKCIEYQEKFVYPCEKGLNLMSEDRRSSYCYHNSAGGLIIEGTDADPFEFRHIVRLGYGAQIDELQWTCAGAIISERFILTAGHCISRRRKGQLAFVLVGALTQADAANISKMYKVKKFIQHPEYELPSQYNDIALLETEETIKLNNYTVPACIHTGDIIDEDRVLATGWGLSRSLGSLSEVLQKVILNKFASSECADKYPPSLLMKYGFNEQSQTCYGDETASTDTCHTDNGGPLHVKSKKIRCMYTIVGVKSFGRPCDFVGEPGVYTRIAHYVDWIESIVWP